MFDVTGDDIAALNDDDLRALIGLLCEAELRRRSLVPSAVTWGGSQTAKDGGLDVRVALARETIISGFVPKPKTGFQVKKSAMPRAAIGKEMRPKGVVRPAILELAKISGAYVIVSSGDSTSDTSLASRKAAMVEAVNDIPDAANLTLDFYDRNRVATWTRDHAGLVLWVLSRIRKSLSGWRAYGSWSRKPPQGDAAYLLDDTARIRTGAKDEGDGISAAVGINKIRDVLRTPGHVARLVGLSGTGKTRLVEALFDPNVGTSSLDPSQALYTDIADEPDPQPVGLASDLIASHTRAILVIDNCPPATHRQLSDVVLSADATISVITIEYDIQEDQPEGTEVFALDALSVPLVEVLVRTRFPDVSQLDAHTIAHFSGGNARIALALGSTVTRTETVAELGDAELFRRLFQQRHAHDASLQSIAEACSLVYSFEGEKTSGQHAELPILAALIGKSSGEIHRAVAELKRRDLLQTRGPWRAVLPHAIANRLASAALKNIPRDALLSGLVEHAPPRLLRSFSRRLGYLDASHEVRTIVGTWLEPGGLLSDIGNLNDLGRAMLDNVAPVAPDGVLSALEGVIHTADEATLGRCSHFVSLLRLLAYDAAHFERAVLLLVKCCRLTDDDAGRNEADVIASLFTIVLSGTHAPVDARVTVIKRLLSSADASEQNTGVKALAAMLKTNHFFSAYPHEFGARSRDYGYHPKTTDDVATWFAAALQLAEPYALSDGTVGDTVRHVIAIEFHGLWTNSSQTDSLERLARAIGGKEFWREGWVAARQTRAYAGGDLSPEAALRLSALELFLRPKDLADKVRGLVLSKGGRLNFDEIDDPEERDYARAAERAAVAVETLGRDLAADKEALRTVLPELAGAGHKLYGLGRGIGLGSSTPRETWGAMVAVIAATSTPGVALLSGFLAGLQKLDAALTGVLLDGALEDPTLAPWFPVLQAGLVIDAMALNRLHRAIDRDAAPAAQFATLAYGRVSDAIPGSDFRRIVTAIAAKPDGIGVALEFVYMRLISDRDDKRQTIPEVLETGKALLAMYGFRRFDGRSGREDYELGEIIRASLADDDGKAIARRLSRNLVDAAARHEVLAWDYDDLLRGLLQVHPVEVLAQLFSGDAHSQRNSVKVLSDMLRLGKSPMDVVSDEILIGWCDRDPVDRYPLAAAVALLFRRPDDKSPHEWTSVTRQLLLRAPDPTAVFREVVRRLEPTAWSGSRATKLESRLELLARLDVTAIPGLADVFNEAKVVMRRRIDETRRRETEEAKSNNGRFE